MENKLFPVKSLVPSVNYSDTISDPELATVYHWDKRGDVQYMSIRTIQIMYGNHPNYRNWVLPDDNEALTALGMTRADYDRIKAAADKASRKHAWF